MPSFPVVIEDTSPMLAFSPTDWRAGVSGDSQLDHQSSYLLTQTDGATISLDFYGSSVHIYGSKRSYHGPYKVQLDKNPYQTFNGLSYTELFQQSLFSANMTLGDHEIRISNQNITFTDVDYIEFQTSVGNVNETLIVNTFQDGHSSFRYAPPTSWRIPDKAGTFIGGTGHATTDPLASANFTFTFLNSQPFSHSISKGDAVALYGPVGPNSCTAYSVKVDNGNPTVFSANRQFYRPQQILFYAFNLGVGQHMLQIQLPGSSTSGEFAIDFATVYTTPSLGGSFASGDPGVNAPDPTSTGGPATNADKRDLFIGIAISAGVAALAIVACIILFLRRSRTTLIPNPNDKEIQRNSAISPFTSLPSAQPTSLNSAESQVSSQPLTLQPAQREQHSKFSLSPAPVRTQGQVPIHGAANHYRAATSTSGSESVVQAIQQVVEVPVPQEHMDISISPPQYTVSPGTPRDNGHGRT
uniref:Transmembrane protein n=1 Tax=Psilocybe cubensis TaxID=181762 RepID=A0A8H7Y2I2_PSICU